MTCSFAAGMAWWVTIVLGGLFLELAFAYGFFRFYASRTNRSVVTLIWGTAAAATLAGVIGILSALPFAGVYCPW